MIDKQNKEEHLKFNKDRANSVKDFVQSPAWVKYMKPWLQAKYEKYSNIISVDETKGIAEFIARKRLAKEYKRMIDLPERWIKEQTNGRESTD